MGPREKGRRFLKQGDFAAVPCPLVLFTIGEVMEIQAPQ
jgi:hypothetical protein